MQLPLIKDGVVVNVVELDPGTICCTKAELNAMVGTEDADFQEKLGLWHAQIQATAHEVSHALAGLGTARDAATRVRESAAKRTQPAEKALQAVLSADGEVVAWEEKVVALKKRPVPVRPHLNRPTRWAIPDGHVLGSPGGNIGDVWSNGAYYAPKEEVTTPEPEAVG